MRRLAVCVALLVWAGACGPGADSRQEVEEVPAAGQVTSTTTGSPIPDPVPPPATDAELRPPPIRVRGGGRELVLGAWSSCWHSATTSTCADGRPPASPEDIGGPAELEVEFPVADWRFTARAMLTGENCGREQTLDLPATGPTTYRLAPIGPAGDYTITLSGRSLEAAAQKGDVATTFRWHTPSAGRNETPTATASIIAGHPPQLMSYGVEVSARALGVSTRKGTVAGSVVVTSAGGASTTIPLVQRDVGDCMPEGSLYLGGSGDLGRQAAALGPAPFRYDVTLVLGSSTYRGTGTWPDDQRSDCSPCTALRFTPPLPAL